MMINSAAVNAVIFDVGNVLISWDPRALYRQLLADEAAVTHFLTEICPPEWNAQQDLGRSWREAVATQSERFPAYRTLIEAWDVRWIETTPSEIAPNAALLRDLKAASIPVWGLTNFSQEKWPVACAKYPFLSLFNDVVVSGEEGVVKPDRRIYDILIQRTGLVPERTMFFDDTLPNVEAARAIGLQARHVTPELDLRLVLAEAGLRV